MIDDLHLPPDGLEPAKASLKAIGLDGVIMLRTVSGLWRIDAYSGSRPSIMVIHKDKHTALAMLLAAAFATPGIKH